VSEFQDKLKIRVAAAVKHYWATRKKQSKRQGVQSGVRDSGFRAAATGGAQLDGFIELIRDLLSEAGLDGATIHTKRSATVVPGFYRPTKSWDLVAVASKRLVACVEVKSHAGPSFGNNFNNRVEEALGNAIDFWKAFQQGVFRPSDRPFLGYILLLEEDQGSTSPVEVSEPHFEVLPEFKGASYEGRYRIFAEKLLRDRLYDSAALLMSARSKARSGEFREPSPELTFAAFAAGLMGRAFAIAKQA
jgi:hypothetical protein